MQLWLQIQKVLGWEVFGDWLNASKLFFQFHLTYKQSLIKVAGERFVCSEMHIFDSAFPSLSPNALFPEML